MASNTSLTKERMGLELVSTYIKLSGKLIKDAVSAFIAKNTIVKGKASSDAMRVSAYLLEKKKGTIGEVDAAGRFLGEDYGKASDFYEHTMRRIQKGAIFTQAFRNEGKFDTLIKELDLQPDMANNVDYTTGIGKRAKRIFETTTYGKELIQLVVDDISAKERAEFFELLANANTDSIFGTDIVYANSGTIWTFDNIISGSFSDSTLRQAKILFAGMTNPYGHDTDEEALAYAFAEGSVKEDVLDIIRVKHRINQNYRGIYEDMADSVMVGKYTAPTGKTGTGNVYLFTDGNGFVNESELEYGDLMVQSGKDIVENSGLGLSVITTKGFVSRTGTVKIQNTNENA